VFSSNKAAVCLLFGALAGAPSLLAGPLVGPFQNLSADFQVLGILVTTIGVVWTGFKMLYGHSDYDIMAIMSRVPLGGALCCLAGPLMAWFGFA
jgi:hypothetical protein